MNLDSIANMSFIKIPDLMVVRGNWARSLLVLLKCLARVCVVGGLW